MSWIDDLFSPSAAQQPQQQPQTAPVPPTPQSDPLSNFGQPQVNPQAQKWQDILRVLGATLQDVGSNGRGQQRTNNLAEVSDAINQRNQQQAQQQSYRQALSQVFGTPNSSFGNVPVTPSLLSSSDPAAQLAQNKQMLAQAQPGVYNGGSLSSMPGAQQLAPILASLPPSQGLPSLMSIIGQQSKSQEPFTLDQGASRFDASGKLIAQNPKPTPPKDMTPHIGVNPQTGKADQFISTDNGIQWLNIAPEVKPDIRTVGNAVGVVSPDGTKFTPIYTAPENADADKAGWQLLQDSTTGSQYRYNVRTGQALDLTGKPYTPGSAAHINSGQARSALAMGVQKFVTENPNATSQDLANYAGQYQRTLAQIGGETKADVGSLSNVTKLYDLGSAQEQSMNGAISQINSLMNQGAGTSVGPVINRWLQAGRKATGDKDVAAFDTAVQTAANEYGKIITGSSAATDASRAEAASMLNRFGSPDQIQSQIGVIQKDAGFKIQSYADQRDFIKSRMGTPAAGNVPIPPQSAAPISAQPTQIPPGAPPASAPGAPAIPAHIPMWNPKTQRFE